jgi:gliding motility-associated-like protein
VSGLYTFAWSRYNHDLRDYDPHFQTDNNVQSSVDEDLQDGGYRVSISGGPGSDTVMLAWIMLNDFQARVDKNADTLLPESYYNCDLLALFGYVDPDSMVYYDPTVDDPLIKVMDFSFKWTSDNEDLKIPNDTIILRPNITYSPPYDDTWYILTATDETGMVEVDSVRYESIQTKAEFSLTYLNKFSGEFTPDLPAAYESPPDFNAWETSTGMQDATLTVRFINESKNGSEFLWVLLDTLGGIREEVVTYDTTEQPEFTYFTAKKFYYPYMYSYSEEGCVDSMRFDQGIEMPASEINIPNVFSPNGDGSNDVWYFKHISLKSCRITVVDRTGKVVYKEKISDIYSWRGWNGKLRDSDRDAPVGQYYFVVEAEGYDGITHKDPTLWSQMRIFGGPGRNNQGQGSGGDNPGGGTPGDDLPNTLTTGWLYLYR